MVYHFYFMIAKTRHFIQIAKPLFNFKSKENLYGTLLVRKYGVILHDTYCMYNRLSPTTNPKMQYFKLYDIIFWNSIFEC